MSLIPPILCLVTDRRRLAAHLGIAAESPETRQVLLTQIAAAAEAGVGLIQVRDPELPARALAALVRDILACVAGHATKVVVSDRLDVALASHADGVHLKSTSVAVADALRLAPHGWLIGRSVHSAAELADGAALGADYVVFGSVFPTRSKPAGWPTAGLHGLAMAVRAARPTPVLGIGGIGPDNGAEVARTGALGVAAIDAFLPSDPARIADTVHKAARRMRIALTRPSPFPNMSPDD